MKFGKSVGQAALPALALCALAVGCVATHRGPVPATDAQDSPREQPAQSVEPVGVLHIVQPGETMWRIARTYDVDLELLAEANDIADPSVLEAGRPLFIPGATETLHIVPAPTAASVDGLHLLWPVPHGRLISTFGIPRRGHRHAGIDIGADRGEPVLAALAGRVTYAGSTMRGYGKTLIIDHGSSLSSVYAHNSRLLVGEGDWVDAGQQIARIGRTGNASTSHCHFEIRRRGVAVNPIPLLQEPEERP